MKIAQYMQEGENSENPFSSSAESDDNSSTETGKTTEEKVVDAEYKEVNKEEK